MTLFWRGFVSVFNSEVLGITCAVSFLVAIGEAILLLPLWWGFWRNK